MKPADEARHVSHEAGAWSESWYFDFATADGVGGYVHLALMPGERRAWYWACFVEPDEGPLVVRDHDLALPRGGALEVRGDGLWAECICETPLEHWSLGLEAFGVRLDDPFDAFHGERGVRMPVGLDLSWEATVDAHEPGPVPCDARAYAQAGRVHGEVLVGPRRVPVDGVGHRSHVWGAHDWRAAPWRWASACTDDGGAFAVTVLGTGAYGTRWDASRAPADVTRASLDPGDTRNREAASMTVGDDRYDVDILAPAPLAIEDAGRPSARLWRALCRYRGRSVGLGWSAWLPACREGDDDDDRRA